MRLEDRLFEVWPGTSFIMYSRGHLLWRNDFSGLATDALADKLEAAGDDTTIYRRLAMRLRHPLPADPPADFELLCGAILLGNGIGLAGAYGTIEPALLLWAAAVRLMEALGIDHPNELLGVRTGPR
ncbi:hypothetical protein D3874_21365 [Oleomonas cavernae]|uniref:Uncharacterized protein n=1 Tax=Oleomonas cavernae TaxID=2320859 RepID=A0A418WGP5_9PROT|nr:hypothetical protein [Oleomonas cavernae]RJF89206.1 hypothetical protein D3874_21365 [Oleomonas cavernae]